MCNVDMHDYKPVRKPVTTAVKCIGELQYQQYMAARHLFVDITLRTSHSCWIPVALKREPYSTLVKSVPAATAAVRRQQCKRSPFTSCSKHRAVCAASSLDGARTTAPGPFGICVAASGVACGMSAASWWLLVFRPACSCALLVAASADVVLCCSEVDF